MNAQQYSGQFRNQMLAAIEPFSNPAVPGTRYGINTVQRFDAAKKQLDDVIESSMQPSTIPGAAARPTNLTRELMQFRSGLMDRVHEPNAQGLPTKNVAYQEARDAWGSAAENQQAVQAGREAFRDGSEISAENFRNLTPSQQRLFRIGASDSINMMMGTKRPGNDVTQLFQQRRVRDLMAEMIPESRGNGVFADRQARFGDYMNRQERMVRTRNEALGGSQTAQRGVDDDVFKNDAALSMIDRFRTMGLKEFALEQIAHVGRQMFGFSQDVAHHLAERLTTTDPVQRAQFIAEITAAAGPQRAQRLLETIDQHLAQVAPSVSNAMPSNNQGPQPRPAPRVLMAPVRPSVPVRSPDAFTRMH
jgi:hypothetical protein